MTPFLIPSERGCYNLSDAKCFPQRSFFSHLSSVSNKVLPSPVEFLRRLFPQWSYSKTFVFPSGSPVTPQCCHALLSSHAFINIALHLRIKNCVLYLSLFDFLSKRRFPIIVSPKIEET